ncbi:SGNH/GDSL hydrolase family protein [Xanthovirga aplysinae]|uniref:SGNH/GDSL hydrolase family protein n=1 Tax=Xanthovirga aplysinae TaxID=2529853 RepID=UPI0012BB7DC6|nr:GDSL-type esterase/lipase family protein [Xanthovirga aplysinae]MTI29612.1 hypothetical protein [Xanthovirga aplysinae]
MRKKRNIQFLVLNTFLLISLVSVLFLYSYQTNTIKSNGNWESSKVKLEKGVMGAYSFITTNRPLAGTHLDLSTYFGYQEIFLKKNLNIESLKFRFKLSTESYFSMYFNKTEDILTGIRISNTPTFPSIFFKSNNGKFLKKTPLNLKKLKNGWNNLQLNFKEKKIEFYLNGNLLTEVKKPFIQGNILGFRGSRSSTLIDNIIVAQNDSSENFKERFDKKGLYSKNSLTILGIFALINIIFYFFSAQRKIILILWVNIGLITGGIGLYYFVNGQYKYSLPWKVRFGDSKVFVHKTGEKISQEIFNTYSTSENKNEKRVMFIGSSQTWGAGASKEELTFIKIFEKKLQTRYPNQNYVCINTGISGEVSANLWNYYKTHWINLKPEFVLINLANNDNNKEHFQENIDKFITQNNQLGIRTILIMEPNDRDDSFLLRNHEALISLANKHKIPLVDMHDFIIRHMDHGFLFWDKVHLTDYGQKIFAEELFKQLENEFDDPKNQLNL